jgi:hypothetical protein
MATLTFMVMSYAILRILVYLKIVDSDGGAFSSHPLFYCFFYMLPLVGVYIARRRVIKK